MHVHQFELLVSDEHWMNIDEQAKHVTFLFSPANLFHFVPISSLLKCRHRLSVHQKMAGISSGYKPRITVTYKSTMLSDFANTTLQVAQFNSINHGQNPA